MLGADQYKKNYAGLSAKDYSIGFDKAQKSNKSNLSIDEIVASDEGSEDGNHSDFKLDDI